ncbi:MAG: ribbon-helix-helix protein, CopG family [Alphaproteobacteria bacterium]
MEILSVRIDAALKRRLEVLAEAMTKTKSWISAEAVRQFVEHNEWQVQAILEGIKSADNMRYIAHAAIQERWYLGQNAEDSQQQGAIVFADEKIQAPTEKTRYVGG